MSLNGSHIISHCISAANSVVIDYSNGRVSDADVLEILEAVHEAASYLARDAVNTDSDIASDPEHVLRKMFMVAFCGCLEWEACLESNHAAEELANPADYLGPEDLN